MNFKLSQIITVGMAAVVMNLAPLAHADDTKLPKEVDKTADVTIVFKMNGGQDVFTPKKGPGVAPGTYERAASVRTATYSISVPMFNNYKQTNEMKPIKLPRAQLTQDDSTGNFIFSTTVNAERKELRFASEKKDGKLITHFNGDDMVAAIDAESAEIRRKIESNPEIAKLTRQFGSSFVIDSVEDSRRTATAPTETITSDPSQHIVIRQEPYTVAITGHAVFKDLENSDQFKARATTNN